MFFQLIAIIITLSLYNSIPIKVIQDMFCINCKQLIQESKKSGNCNASTKYKNSLDETLNIIHCSHVKQCYEMCNKKWKYYTITH